MPQCPGDAIESLGRLIEAVQGARDHDGVVLCHLEPEAVGRVVAALAVTRHRAQWSPAERLRHLERLASDGGEG